MSVVTHDVAHDASSSPPSTAAHGENEVKTKKKRYRNGNVKFTCEKCGKIFEGATDCGIRANYLRHLRGHDGIRPFGCDLCTARFQTRQNLHRHMISVHRDVTSIGGESRGGHGSGFTTPAAATPILGEAAPFPVAVEGDQPTSAFSCEICSKVFAFAGSLRYHQRQFHAQELKIESVAPVVPESPLSNQPGRFLEVQCEDCGAILSSRAKLSRHLKKHCPLRHQSSMRQANRETGDHFEDHRSESEASINGDQTALVGKKRERKPKDHSCHSCSVEGCFEAFSKRRSLRRHMANAHTKPPLEPRATVG